MNIKKYLKPPPRKHRGSEYQNYQNQVSNIIFNLVLSGDFDFMQEKNITDQIHQTSKHLPPILLLSKQSSPLSSFGPCLNTHHLRKNSDDDLHSLPKTKIIAHENRLSQNGSNISSLQIIHF